MTSSYSTFAKRCEISYQRLKDMTKELSERIKDMKARLKEVEKDFITGIIAKARGIKNKSPEEQQRIIRTFIKKVVVYPNKVDVISEVDTYNGAEGS